MTKRGDCLYCTNPIRPRQHAWRIDLGAVADRSKGGPNHYRLRTPTKFHVHAPCGRKAQREELPIPWPWPIT